MLVTTILTFFVIRFGWGYPLALCIAATGFFVFVDVALLLVQPAQDRGRRLVPARARRAGVHADDDLAPRPRARRGGAAPPAIPLAAFLESLAAHPPHRVAGTAVFMAGDPDGMPNALLHNLKHNKVLHERVVFLTVAIRDVPWVPPDERVVVEPLGDGFFRLIVHFGFMDRPDVAGVAGMLQGRGLAFDLMETTFFLSRATVMPTPGGGMALGARSCSRPWRATRAPPPTTSTFPPTASIELGTKVEI